MHPSPSSRSISSRIFPIVGRIAPGLPLVKYGNTAPPEVEMTFAPRLQPTLFNHKAIEHQMHVPQIEGAASVFSMPLSRLRYNYLDGVFHCLLSRGFVGGRPTGRGKIPRRRGCSLKKSVLEGGGKAKRIFCIGAIGAGSRGICRPRGDASRSGNRDRF